MSLDYDEVGSLGEKSECLPQKETKTTAESTTSASSGAIIKELQRHDTAHKGSGEKTTLFKEACLFFLCIHSDFKFGGISYLYSLFCAPLHSALSQCSTNVLRNSWTYKISITSTNKCGSRARAGVDPCPRKDGESESKGYFRITTHYSIG